MSFPSHRDSDRAISEILALIQGGWELDPALEQSKPSQSNESVGYKVRQKAHPSCRASIVFYPTAFDMINGSEWLKFDAKQRAKLDLQALSDSGSDGHIL